MWRESIFYARQILLLPALNPLSMVFIHIKIRGKGATQTYRRQS
jgi:hypothetical protein